MNLNIYDILILLALACIIFSIIRSIIRAGKKGGCAGCKGCNTYKSGK